MKNHYFYYILFFLVFFKTQGQTNNIESFETKMDTYFELDPETFFTHINKTTFFPGEEIWFKNYIYNTKTQLPYISSTNIYTSIFDEDGKLIEKKIFVAQNGMNTGNIKIDSTYNTGTYFIKTSTNWAKNFDIDYSFTQKINIINEHKIVKKEENTKTSYDFQLLPEGGYIVENTINTVGFKLVDSNGKSVPVSSGKLLDSNNNIITIFKSNVFGLGKFVFKPKSDVNYTCQIVLENGKSITKKIDAISKNGISLNVDNNKLEDISIHLNTNKNTLSNLQNKKHYLIIHRDGLIKKIEVSFTKNQLIYSYNIKRELLLRGINIITLVNENQVPIAERVIFNNGNSSIKSLEIAQVIKEKDSSIIKLKSDATNKNINLSISVLPASTKANNNSTSIISSFLIKPYINGIIENPWYYFNEIDREKIYNLDLLLLTQGWSKYSWNNIFNNPPKISHNFETGFEIKGKLNSNSFSSGDKIILQSLENGFQEEFNIDESGFFNFKNLYLQEESTLHFSIKNKNGNQSAPKLYYNLFPINTNDYLDVKKNLDAARNTRTTQLNDTNNFVYENNITILDGVKLKDVYTKPKPINKIIGANNSKHISFKDATNTSSLITHQLQAYFETNNDGFNVSILSRRHNVLKGPLSPRVFLDNVDISSDLSIISQLRVSDVEEMFVNQGLSSIFNAAGVIQLFTKRGKSSLAKPSFKESKISFGFSISKEYYNPMYNKQDMENYNNYATLHWVPTLTKNEKGEILFKIPNYYYDAINLYIEGMNSNGELFSKIETINLKSIN